MTDVVGQKQTPASLAGGLVTPMSLRDVAVTMEQQGIPKGTAMSLLSILGVGMNTYGPYTQYMTGTPAERKKQFDKDLKRMGWETPRLAYDEFLSSAQLERVEQRREKDVANRAVPLTLKKPNTGGMRLDFRKKKLATWTNDRATAKKWFSNQGISNSEVLRMYREDAFRRLRLQPGEPGKLVSRDAVDENRERLRAALRR